MIEAVVQQSDDHYQVTLDFKTDELFENVHIEICPLRIKQGKPFAQTITFDGLTELQLSVFYEITVLGNDASISRVIMIPTKGIPVDREKRVIESVIKDKSSFIEYVSFILGDDNVSSAMEDLDYKRTASEGKGNDAIMPAVYEKMLKTALSDSERFQEIDYLLREIDNDEIISQNFRDLYNQFRSALGLKDNNG